MKHIFHFILSYFWFGKWFKLIVPFKHRKTQKNNTYFFIFLGLLFKIGIFYDSH